MCRRHQIWDGHRFVPDESLVVTAKILPVTAFVYGDLLPSMFPESSRFERREREGGGRLTAGAGAKQALENFYLSNN